MKLFYLYISTLLILLSLYGCNESAVKPDGVDRSQDLETISQLSNQLTDIQARNAALEKEMSALQSKSATPSDKAMNDRTEKLYQELKKTFKNEISKGNIKINKIYNLISFSIQEQVFFDSGRANITPKGKSFLNRLGKAFRKMDNKFFFIEGHTDNIPMAPENDQGFYSNWELSSARALQVIHYLQETCDVNPKTLCAISYSQYRPIASNTTAKGRAKNRRIQISIVDRSEYNITRLENAR